MKKYHCLFNLDLLYPKGKEYDNQQQYDDGTNYQYNTNNQQAVIV
jgi:hypothetical protein